ncbi:MAG: hypothetical protein IJB90_03225 [Clostridia bacterium]|nr:hypothetical protein [Clostridia bacterium]
MNRIIRWYNKNRKIFWLVVFIAIIIINVPIVLNEYAKDKKESSSISNNTTTYNNKSYSIISGETVKEETNTENMDIINIFVNYCNNGEIEKAYEVLSNNCKQQLYPTIDQFKDKYYNSVFNNKKSCDIQAWVSNGKYYTYKINLKEDILSTGNANSSSIEDYYTIIYEDGSYKLNINSYIGSVEINKFNQNAEVRIEVLNKDVYMDYEIYNLKIQSKNGKSILLDSLEKTDTMYLEDSNNLQYSAYNHELVTEKLRVRTVKNVGIKFNKKYTTERKIQKIVFSDIILDYDNYISYTNKSEFKNRVKMEIEL